MLDTLHGLPHLSPKQCGRLPISLWAKSGETTPHHGVPITYLEVFQHLPTPIRSGLYKEHGFIHHLHIKSYLQSTSKC